MAGVFHVQFGINETPLSQALEYGQFDVAEKMIKECTSASDLDEGFYTRTPLVICLKPRVEGQINGQINFHIAKLLIEHGADPNIRIPNTDGAEFIDSGQSPLEIVTKLFSIYTRCSVHPEKFTEEAEERLFNNFPVIGLHKKHITSYEELLEHIYGMSAVLLGYGANINVMDTCGISPLKTILGSCQTQLKLLELFLENGADANAGNFTPLMYLCRGQLSLSLVDDEWRKQAGGCLHEKHNERNLQKLETIFEVGHVEINKTNKRNQTALFVACASSEFAQGKILLREGASPDIKGGIDIFNRTTNENNESSGASGTVDVTPLIAALVGPKIQAEIIDFPDKPLKLLELGDIIDTGKLCSNVIWEEFCEIITSLFSSFTHLLKYGPKLIGLMFGNTTSDLVQRTTRNIFHNLFKIHGSTKWKTGKMADLKSLELKHYWKMDECVDSQPGATSNLSVFVSKLGLPTHLVERFEIEWLRLCLCAYYSNALTTGLIASDYGHVNDDDDSDDYENDSDMEFW